jgi:hypothetical protein
MKGGKGMSRITLKQVSARKKNIAVARAAKSRMGGGGPGGGAFGTAYKKARAAGLSKRIARYAGHAEGVKMSPSFIGKVKAYAKGTNKGRSDKASDYVGSIRISARFR